MGRSHLLAGACVVLTGLLFAGCASKPRPAAHPSSSPDVANNTRAAPGDAGSGAPPQRSGEGPTADSSGVTSKSVAQHTENYAKNLESLLAKRAPRKSEGAKPQSAEPGADALPETETVEANGALKVKAPQTQKSETTADSGADADVAAAPGGVQPAGKSPAPAPAAQPAASRVAASVKPPQASQTTDLLIQKISARLKDYPRDAAAQLDYQLLQFLRDEPVPELGPISPLPGEDRELITTLLDGLSNFRNGLRAEGNMLQSRKVAPLLEMGDRLRAQGELNLPNTALCTKVERFGVYEPMEPAQFKAGTNNEAVLYCEVANFSSQLADGRQWETKLKHECVLYSETGLAAWQDKADTVTDLSRNRRHDFYVVKRLRVPALPVGRYLLKVTVTDLQMNRVAEATVPIQVIAQ